MTKYFSIVALMLGLTFVYLAQRPSSTTDPNIGLGFIGLLGYILVFFGLATLLGLLRGWKKLIPVALGLALVAWSVIGFSAGNKSSDETAQKAAQARQIGYKALPYAVRAPAALADDPSTNARTPGLYGKTVVYQFKSEGKTYLFMQYPTDSSQTAANICTKLPQGGPTLGVKSCTALEGTEGKPAIYMARLDGGDQAAFTPLNDSTVSLVAAGLASADATRILGSLETIDIGRAYKLGIFY